MCLFQISLGLRNLECFIAKWCSSIHISRVLKLLWLNFPRLYNLACSKMAALWFCDTWIGGNIDRLHGWPNQNVFVAHGCRVFLDVSTNSLVRCHNVYCKSICWWILVKHCVLMLAAEQNGFLHKQSWVFVRCSVDLNELVFVQVLSNKPLVSWDLIDCFDVAFIV